MTAILSSIIALIFIASLFLILASMVKDEFLSFLLLGMGAAFLPLIMVAAMIPQTNQYIISLLSAAYQMLLVLLTGFSFWLLIKILYFLLNALKTAMERAGSLNFKR